MGNVIGRITSVSLALTTFCRVNRPKGSPDVKVVGPSKYAPRRVSRVRAE
jgi:hypothetical protein